jgi:hypothetical protein
MPGRLVPPIQTARSKYPVRIHSANPAAGYAPFTREQLAKAVQNWQKYQKGHVSGFPDPNVAFILPPANVGLGHEEDQAVLRMILGRTDLPNAGHPDNVWIDNAGDVYATLDGMPVPVASMVNSGLLKSVSVQIYPDYLGPDGKRYGPVFKRIDLIGAAQPRQKGLGGLSPMVFSEPRASRPGVPAQQYVASFSEVSPMDRTDIIAQLQAAGVDVSVITDAIPTEFLQAVLQTVLAAKGAAPTPGAAGGAVPTGPITFSEATVLGIIDRALPARLNSALAPIAQTLNALAGQVGSVNRQNDRQAVLTFCEQNKEKIFPFEMDAKLGPTLVDRLMGLSNDPQQVVSFTESGGTTVQLTPRQLEMRAIASRPKLPISFAEGISAEERGRQIAGAGHSLSGSLPTRPGDVSDARRLELMSQTPLGRAILANKPASRN